jgi:GNAT superfamily N-acetyltransferase
VPELFKPEELVPAGRTVLSRLAPADVGDMPWLAATLAPEWSVEDFQTAEALCKGILISDNEGAPIGLALVRPQIPAPGDATISFLAVQPERRYRGLGGEAGLAVERLLRQRWKVARVLAGVPEGRGLAVYFWLRLGFRPLSAADAPGAPLGLTGESLPGIWMLRDTP